MSKWLLLISGLTFSVQSATLIPEKGISVLYINGLKTEQSVGIQHIDSGETEVIVRLDKDFSRGSSKNIFTSSPYVVKFNVTGEEVKFLHPIARSYQEAESVFRGDRPQWKLIQDGKPVAYQQELLPPKEGLFPYLGMDTIVSDYYSDKNGEVTKKGIAVAVKTSEEVSSKSAKPQVDSNLAQLKAWYLKSSPDERKAFRKWIIDQE